MALPTFLVIGAPRCATTTLHYALAGHDQVRMSAIKEPNHFLFSAAGEPSIEERSIITKSVRSRSAYEGLFGRDPNGMAIGEASPLYLYVRDAAPRIREACGPARIVAVVRNPVDRAWSHFLHAFPGISAGDAEGRFAELVEAELVGGPGYTPYRTPTHLLRLGRYGSQLPSYLDAFGPERVLVLLLEEVERDPAATGACLGNFLGIDPVPLDATYNTSGRTAGGDALGRLRAVVGRVQPLVKAAMPPRVAGRLARLRATVDDRSLHPVPMGDAVLRARLDEWFADDVASLSELLGRDLSHWAG